MIIKRGFTYIGSVRKFKVFVNDEEIESIKTLGSVEVDQPKPKFKFQIRTMKLERSKEYIVQTDKDILVKTNVNIFARLNFILSFTLAFLLVVSEVKNGVIFAILALTFTLVLHLTYFTKRYISVRVYDLDKNRIAIEEL